jgi:hypothetical protein
MRRRPRPVVGRAGDLGEQVGRVVLAQLQGAQVQGAVGAVEQERVGVQVLGCGNDLPLGAGEGERRGDASGRLGPLGLAQRGLAPLGVHDGHRVHGQPANSCLHPPVRLPGIVVRPPDAVPDQPAAPRWHEPQPVAIHVDEPPRVPVLGVRLARHRVRGRLVDLLVGVLRQVAGRRKGRLVDHQHATPHRCRYSARAVATWWIRGQSVEPRPWTSSPASRAR